MTIEERRKALSAKITEYFNAKSIHAVIPSDTLILSSKLNSMQDNAIMDEEFTYQRHIVPKKNYHGTKHEVVKKETHKKSHTRQDASRHASHPRGGSGWLRGVSRGSW